MWSIRNDSERVGSNISTKQSNTRPADPAILVEADGEADTKKALKQICFPLMDDDGLPSSYIQKILGAIGKWKLKMHGIITSLSLLEDPPETVEAFLTTIGAYGFQSSVIFDYHTIQI